MDCHGDIFLQEADDFLVSDMTRGMDFRMHKGEQHSIKTVCVNSTNKNLGPDMEEFKYETNNFDFLKLIGIMRVYRKLGR